MGWIGGTSNAYKKNSDNDNFKFLKKKKKKFGLATNLAVAVKAMVDVNKQTKPLL